VRPVLIEKIRGENQCEDYKDSNKNSFHPVRGKRAALILSSE
jgi:hypothetical protein